METISEHDFHTLHEERPGASIIMQGYARTFGCEAYFAMNQQMNEENLRTFIKAFNLTPSGDVTALWKQVRKIFNLPELDPQAKARLDAQKVESTK